MDVKFKYMHEKKLNVLAGEKEIHNRVILTYKIAEKL